MRELDDVLRVTKRRILVLIQRAMGTGGKCNLVVKTEEAP